MSGVFSAAPHLAICTACLPAVLAQYQHVVDDAEPSEESIVLLDQVMNAILECLNTSSHQSASSLDAWFDHVIRRFDLPTMDQLGIDASMMQSILDHAMERMTSDSVFVRRDLDAILRDLDIDPTPTHLTVPNIPQNKTTKNMYTIKKSNE